MRVEAHPASAVRPVNNARNDHRFNTRPPWSLRRLAAEIRIRYAVFHAEHADSAFEKSCRGVSRRDEGPCPARSRIATQIALLLRVAAAVWLTYWPALGADAL